MKIILLFFQAVFLLVIIVTGTLFVIIPQAIEGRQILYILTAGGLLALMTILTLTGKAKFAFVVFLGAYPFFHQLEFYFNISTSYFILTPVLLILYLLVLFSKLPNLNRTPFLYMFSFGFFAFPSVLVASNIHTASTYYILAFGTLVISTILAYSYTYYSSNKMKYIWQLMIVSLIGSLVYFLIEIVFFQLRPEHFIFIILRRWELLPIGRFPTLGYREPAGFGYVFSILFWIFLYYSQQRNILKKYRFVTISALIFSAFVLLMSGTRSVLLSIFNTFLVFYFLRIRTGIKSRIKIKPLHLVLIMIVVSVGLLLVIPRSFVTQTNHNIVSGGVAPTSINVLGVDLTMVGTTANYYNRTMATFLDLITHPLGTGPANASIDPNNYNFEQIFHFSFISNIISIGASFGWISMLIWIIFIIYLYKRLILIRKNPRIDTVEYGLALLLLSIIIASILPGSSFFGPFINWGNFDIYEPISNSVKGLPAEYIPLYAGIVIGILLSLITKFIHQLYEVRD